MCNVMLLFFFKFNKYHCWAVTLSNNSFFASVVTRVLI